MNFLIWSAKTKDANKPSVPIRRSAGVNEAYTSTILPIAAAQIEPKPKPVVKYIPTTRSLPNPRVILTRWDCIKVGNEKLVKPRMNR